MAKAVKKPVEYARIRPIFRSMLDPYKGVRVSPDNDEGIVMDKKRAEFHVDMGDAEYIEEECADPFAKPEPVKAEPAKYNKPPKEY